MLNSLSMPLERTIFQDIHPTLPKMASLFINELLIRQPSHRSAIPVLLKTSARPRTIRVPLDPLDPIDPLCHEKVRSQEVGGSSDRSIEFKTDQPATSWKQAKQQSTVRSLVKGISHHFNNLLMGVWGNLSLIRLNVSKTDPVTRGLDEMETLIQEGAYFTHLILGYLGERRVFAQRIRLKQLTKEIQVLLQKKTSLGEFIGRLEWIALSRQPGLVTGSTGMIFEQLLNGVKDICQNLETEHCAKPIISERLTQMDNLLEKGLTLTHLMRCSSGHIKLNKRWINPHHVVRYLVNRTSGKHPDISVTHKVSPAIPLLLADRGYLIFALEHIIDNACRSMLDVAQAKLEIGFNMLQEEPPEERCGIHSIGNCLVVTIKDNGKGIPAQVQPHIFEPFFTHPVNSSLVGLGLAFVRGIIRSHGGHIQIQSTPSIGSVFKVYVTI